MNSIKQWLEERGLGKYSKTFEEQEIDFDALPHLTDGMLERIGLLAGPRARLLAAIAELKPNRPKGAYSERGESADELDLINPQSYAERRQMTAMFCDLVDYTGMVRRHPEDLNTPINSYVRMCREVIEYFGGEFRESSGDGIMALFGRPAFEDAAERAIRAGLEIINRVKNIHSPEPFNLRVGISTGTVIIAESNAVGDPLNVASRLQSLAEPNSLLISQSTSRLVSKRFHQESLGVKELKGLAPSEVFRILGVRDEFSRFEGSQRKAPTPFVGRSSELALLQQRWQEAKEGEGQAVYVLGMAGIGKSRIVVELEKSLESDEHITLRFQCLSNFTQSAFFPVIRQIEREARIATTDSVTEKLGKIRMSLSNATDRPESILPFMSQIVSLFENPGQVKKDQTRQGKAQILSVLVQHLLLLTAKRPVLCIVEDEQWIDPSTRELLDLVIDRIGLVRILLIVTRRTESVHQSLGSGNVSALTISRLTRRETTDLVHQSLRDPAVPNSTVRDIVIKSEGIPLFAEELARGVDESEEYSKDPTAVGRHAISAGKVPAVLHGTLMMRLDRAPEARNVAQRAAVIGREFSYQMLSWICRVNGACQ